MGRPKLYTDEEMKAKKKEWSAKWRATNKEKIAGYYIAKKQEYIDKAAEWRKNNPERANELARKSAAKPEKKAKKKAYRESNKESFQEYMKEWREKNKERLSERGKKYRQENKEALLAYDKHKNTIRYRLIGGQMLAKIYAKEVRAIYRACPPGYHVDHIVPLRGKNVCGLHIPVNLQYLPAAENLKKSNKLVI